MSAARQYKTGVVSNLAVAGWLADTYGWTLERAARVASIATVYGTKAEPCPGGYVSVTYRPETADYTVEDHTGRPAS